MEQLSGLDNMFLALEDTRQHMHIASLGLYDPSTAKNGEVRFKQVLDFFNSKVSEVPFFRRRLAEVPLGLDRPFWIDDHHVDVEYHVRHLALPKPGDWRQLMIQVARLHSRPLDHSKPLWEVYVIGGLDNIEGIKKGSFGIYMKMHHAAVDGQAAAKLMQILHTLTPEYEVISEPDLLVAEKQPSSAELLMRSFVHRGKQVAQGVSLSRELGQLSVKLGTKYAPKVATELRSALLTKVGLKKLARLYAKKPRTRFDAAVSPHRVVDAIGISLADCKRIREFVPGATVNDIFMSTSGGAVRAYLQAHDELPERTLNSMMPVAAASKGAGNAVSMAIVPVHSEIEDPIERLYKIKQSTLQNKDLLDDIGRDLLPKVMELTPAFTAKLAMESGMMDNASLTISNVRGPDVALYLAGARCQMSVPVSIPCDRIGLNITGFSYLDTMWICVTACREMLPDPAFFSDCLRESFDQLLQAALAQDSQKSKQDIQKSVRKTPAKKKRAKKINAKTNKKATKKRAANKSS